MSTKFFVPVMVAVLVICANAHAEDADADAPYIVQLKAIDPAAVPIFEDANDARDSADYARARDLYSQVHAMAPAFTVATRREAMVKMALGQTDGVVALLRDLESADPSPENEIALANALVGMGTDISPAVRSDARAHLAIAFSKAPDTVFVWQDACDIAVRTSDHELLHTCSQHLDSLVPEAMSTWTYRMYDCAATGDVAGARSALEGAHARGLPESTYQSVRESLDRKVWTTRILIALGVVALGCLALLAKRRRSRHLVTVMTASVP